VGAAPFDHEELCGITHIVEKEAGSQIDPPSFRRMLHVGVGFHGIVGEMSGSAEEAWLEHIKGFHLLRQFIFNIPIWIDMAEVEDSGTRYLDAYIALHDAILCVKHLMHTQSGEVSSLLAHLRTDLDSYHAILRAHLMEDAEGDLFAQRVEVNADRELPAYLPRDPRMIVNQIIGGYLLEAIGSLRSIPGEEYLVQRMRDTLSGLQQIHDAFPEGEIQGGKTRRRRKGIRHSNKRKGTRRVYRARRTRRGGDLNNGANAALHVNPNHPVNHNPPPYIPQLMRNHAIPRLPALPPANVIHPIEPAGPIHFPPFAFPPMPQQHVNMDVSGVENRMNVEPAPNQGGKRRARRTRRTRRHR
jgi:hypothetical protein